MHKIIFMALLMTLTACPSVWQPDRPATWKVSCEPRPKSWLLYNFKDAQKVYIRLSKIGRKCEIYHFDSIVDPLSGEEREVEADYGL